LGRGGTQLALDVDEFCAVEVAEEDEEDGDGEDDGDDDVLEAADTVDVGVETFNVAEEEDNDDDDAGD
jgi:hypothetical protein